MAIEKILRDIKKLENDLVGLNTRVEELYGSPLPELLDVADDIKGMMERINGKLHKGFSDIKSDRKTFDELIRKILSTPELVSLEEIKLYHSLKRRF